MAAAAYQLRERDRLKKMAIVLRFLGTTPHSSNIRHTLRSICEQVYILFIITQQLIYLLPHFDEFSCSYHLCIKKTLVKFQVTTRA